MKRKPTILITAFAVLAIAALISSCVPGGAPPSVSGASPAPSPAKEADGPYPPGEYSASAMGNNGLVNVKLVLGNARIEEVVVDSGYETAGLGDTAAQQIASSIVENQSLVIDAVAGATYTSRAVLQATQTALEQAGIDTATFLQPADASLYNGELEHTEADVIVVGGGMAGMTAALRAAEEGATVLLYERSGILGGAARYAMGWISGADFNIQRKLGVTEDSADLFYQDIIGFAGGEEHVNKMLARYYAEHSGPAIDWLEKTGVEFKDELNVGIYDPMSVYRVAWGKENGLSIVKGLEAAIAAEARITVRAFTEVTELILENDVVTGVKIKDHRGNTGTATAKSTILATGGFGASEERLSGIFENIAVGYISTADGSGYKLAEQAGAAFHTPNYNPITGGVLPVDGFYSNIRMDVRYNGVIFVDQTGKRVFDEIGSNYKARSDAWIKAPGNTLYAILSDSMLNRAKPLLSAGNSWTPSQDTDWAIFDHLVAEGEHIYKADTLEELAEKAALDPATLVETLERYNGYAESGRDRDFNRAAEQMLVFESGPYYAIPTIPYAGRSASGPVVNEKMQVLNARNAVIPGLYAAGEIIGFSAISGEASVSGMYLGEAATYGIGAGLNAANRALLNKAKE